MWLANAVTRREKLYNQFEEETNPSEGSLHDYLLEWQLVFANIYVLLHNFVPNTSFVIKLLHTFTFNFLNF